MKRIRSWRGHLLTLLFLFTPAFSIGAPVTLNSVEVIVHGAPKPDSFRKLIPFVAGQKTSREEIEETLSELNALDLFTDVDYRLIPSGIKGSRLTVELTEAKTVRDIRVAGNY